MHKDHCRHIVGFGTYVRQIENNYKNSSAKNIYIIQITTLVSINPTIFVFIGRIEYISSYFQKNWYYKNVYIT